MGIMVRGSMIKRNKNKKVRVALEGREIFSDWENEKVWEPKRVIEYYEGYIPQVKEKENKWTGEFTTKLVGKSRWTDCMRKALLAKMTNSGRIRGGDRRYWNVKVFKGRSDRMGFDEVTAEVKKPEKWLLPKVKKGDSISILGTDYEVFRIFKGKLGIVNRQGGKKWIKQTTLSKYIRSNKAYKIGA